MPRFSAILHQGCLPPGSRTACPTASRSGQGGERNGQARRKGAFHAVSHPRISSDLDAASRVHANELLGLWPTVPGDENNSGFHVVRIETVRDAVGFPHNVADCGPALMVKNYAPVWPTLRVPLVGNFQQIGISGEQSAGLSDSKLQVLHVGNGPAQASFLRRQHVDATSPQPVDDALIDVLVCVERNHALARCGA